MAWTKDNGKQAKIAAEMADTERLLTEAEREATEAVRLETIAVKNANKTKWLPAVATVALRNSTYPNPQNGDTVRITGDASVYRFDSVSGWVKTDEYNPAVVDSLTAQLADTAKKSELQSLVVNKAEKTYVDTLTASLASGSPKGTYATLSALQTAFPTGNSNIYVVTADGKWYYWNGSAWTAGGTYQSTGIARNSINQENLSFTALMAVKSKNLFNKATVITGYYVDYLTGNNAVNASYSASDFTPVSPNTTYTQKSNKQFAFYDANKLYISGLASATTFTTPANCYYVRLSILNVDLATQQLELGASSTAYESYVPKVNTETITDRSITKEKLDFVPLEGATSKNLFDKTKVTNNAYVDYRNGEIAPNVNNVVSDFIPVQPLTQYTKVDNSQFVFYRLDKTLISGVASATTFTTPANCYYVRVTVKKTMIDKEQLELGSVSTSYESYGVKLLSNNLPSGVAPFVNNNVVQFKIELPSTIYLVSGESFSIYYNNVIKYSQAFRKGNYYFAHINKSGSVAKGTGLDYKWEYTPTQAESFIIEFAIFETYTGTKVASKLVTFIVADSSLVANHGRTANIISIGDSFVDLYGVNKHLYNFLKTNGGGNNPNMIGTRDAGVVGAKDDALSGWGYSMYTQLATHNEKVNSFWNPTTNKFDFSYYMSQNFPSYVPSGQTGEHIDSFLSMMGLNDSIWDGFNGATIRAAIQNIIDSVKGFDQNIKILLSTVTPQPIGDKFLSDFGNYPSGGNYEKSKYNQEVWNEMMLEFDNPANKIWVIPTNAHFDTRNSILSSTIYPDKFTPAFGENQTNDIHPNDAGSKYIADAMYQAIYNLVLR